MAKNGWVLCKSDFEINVDIEWNVIGLLAVFKNLYKPLIEVLVVRQAEIIKDILGKA